MRKIIFTLTVIVVSATVALSQKWDRQMEVKKMDIRVKTDAFTATTFIEMEFCNPYDTELEGLYTFGLEPGQAITAFQLDLFGKFRDGSIEEKWKARNAYNTIVGKRVDPALLEMNGYNQYHLRIYPVPAKGCRRITMTIQQLLQINGDKAVYKLPLRIKEVIEKLDVQIKVSGSDGSPSVIKGLLTNQSFSQNNNLYELNWVTNDEKADQPLSFSIPLSLQQPSLCIKTTNDETYFALRLKPQAQKEYTIHPSKITVFWDISAINQTRNTSKEIAFLKQYVSINKIAQLTIITFNQKIQDTAIFYTGGNFDSRWADYLKSFKYEGATHFGALDLSTVNADAILIFTDGRNSYGKSLPVAGKTHVYCINSAIYADTAHIEKIIGKSGGCFIDLHKKDISEAVVAAGKAENILVGLKANGITIDLNENLSDLKEDTLLLSGKIPAGSQQISLLYGNNGNVLEEEVVKVSAGNSCDESPVERISMLAAFDEYVRSGTYWYNLLEWGKKEKVVTHSTSYIVLEKIEDYVKFNITPPKELEDKCDMNLFVQADQRRRNEYKKLNEFEVLTQVAYAYNARITEWDKGQPPIVLTEQKQPQVIAKTEKDETNTVKDKVVTASSSTVVAASGFESVQTMSEVVVTSLGQSRQAKELGYSAARVTAADLTQASPVNLQNGLTGKVSGLNVQTVNNGVFGDTRITLRGIRSLTGNNQPMLILDGSPIALGYLNSINPRDILTVTVLKGANATAIYGPDGVNGALVIQTKRGSRNSYSYFWSSYRLKDREDVDYLQEIRSSLRADMPTIYNDLKKTFGFEAGFYFDMAQHFYSKGLKKEAVNILYSAADISSGNWQVQLAMAYILETWKEFDEAISIYRSLLQSDPQNLLFSRNIALAWYQKGNYQEAVNAYYKGICMSHDSYSYISTDVKTMMLQEMNAIIMRHKNSIDISGINQQLIRPIDFDLRVTLECNNRTLEGNMSVTEPGGKTSYYYNSNESKGKITRHAYYYGSITPEEYQVKNAQEGKYKIKISYTDYNGYYYYQGKVPTVIRILTFKNSGKENEMLTVENVIMDNQYGDVEIAEVNWEGTGVKN
ncbi:MAG: TonB-dependent receptor plug domain-containing protein [Chitinophagaceae bacterium]|nr:TonB-dependent receptor plug domain-containing protein [Chitinophagaceae bacterium]